MTTILANELISPSIQLSHIRLCKFSNESSNIDDKFIPVVRDDYLKGGTKQRAAVPFLETMKYKGIVECIYASPFCGYAQVAIAASCSMVGLQCTIFVEENPGGGFSPFSELIRDYANVFTFRSLDEAEKEAELYAKDMKGVYKIPLGLNNALYQELLMQELKQQWVHLRHKLGYRPKRLWVPVGSGTLARAFRKALPSDITLVCVNVKVLPEFDDRIVRIKSMENTIFRNARQDFHQPAEFIPPIQSNTFYDAKLWELIINEAESGDVWWNVA